MLADTQRPDDAARSGRGVREPAPATSPGRAFLDTYVEPDGRVTRHDQGGDTVSEGQAYGLLIALTEGDRTTFRRIWGWTRDNLQRDDGLLSWHWGDGRVLDRGAATDADVDTARALVLAGRQFRDGRLARDGVRLARAVMTHETVPIPQGRVLVAGDWAVHAPYWFNPSYVSPVTADLLEQATGDHRWQAVEEGSRALVYDLTVGGDLPPDWARVSADGEVTPSPSPDGRSIRYGHDATRTILRQAESCEPVDQQIAASAAGRLALTSLAYGELDLSGVAMSEHESPVARAARAAAYARSGWSAEAFVELTTAALLDAAWPTYYGAAWSVLGRRMLTDPALGGCPPLLEVA